MQQRPRGQSIVEMALLMPLLLMVLFGIIEFGYYIYSFAVIHQAARNGAEIASGAPPFPNRVSPIRIPPYVEDTCIATIVNTSLETIVLDRPDMSDPDERAMVQINYPAYAIDPKTKKPLDPLERRQIGYPIEVTVSYRIEPLTPLWYFVPLGNNGVMTVTATARRSIEGFDRDPSTETLSACEQ